MTYPSGYAVNYVFSGIDAAVSRPTSITGQSAGSTAAVTLEAFKYLGAGTVVERSRPEVNVALSMVNFSGTAGSAGDKYTGIDRFGRVVDQRWTKGTTATSPVVDRYGYTYDRNSNRLTRSNALATTFSETYAYDALNQLQSFNRTGGTTKSQQWQFDALGNWTTVTTNGVAQNRTANAQNELTQVGNSSLAYSRTGNLTTDAQGRTLSYDAWNRLVSVKNAAGTEVARYGYDGLNRRIVEQVGALASPAAATAPVRDVYFSQEWQALEERVRTSTGTIPATADTRFIWSPVYVDAMVARDRNADNSATTGTGGLEQRVYALQDANWNTTAIIAATGVPGVTAGNVINRFAYTPYGESQTLTASWATPPAGSTPAVPWAHLFQGLEFTDVTGLAYVRHRDYSATLGRFIELDPIGFSAGDNNWYRFVANGPTGRTDPSGLDWSNACSGGITTSGCNSTITVTPPCGDPQLVPSPAPRPSANRWTVFDNEAAWRAEWTYDTHGGLTAIGVRTQFQDGFSATLTRAPSGTYYLAFRGTEDFFGPEDGGANVAQAFGFRTRQYEQAVALARDVKRNLPPGSRLILTGHSLGGGLATAAAYATGAEAITFNAASVNAYYRSQGQPGNIRSHIVFADPLSVGRTCLHVSRFGPIVWHRRLPGTVIVHPPLVWNTHSMDNFPRH
jgi:RHS repeat-associated protein